MSLKLKFCRLLLALPTQFLAFSLPSLQILFNSIKLQFIRMQKSQPKGYILVHNISKKNNIGNIIRSACAFGIQKVFYISKKLEEGKKPKVTKEFSMHGNQNTFKKMEYQPFPTLDEMKKYLVENDIKLCGVEIGEGSKPIQAQPFQGKTAFLFGNEGDGMHPAHKKYCDFFVYIPQYTSKTASLNVSVAAGIVFHHFAMWAGFQESQVFGQKYQEVTQKQEKEEIEQSDQIDKQ